MPNPEPPDGAPGVRAISVLAVADTACVDLAGRLAPVLSLASGAAGVPGAAAGGLAAGPPPRWTAGPPPGRAGGLVHHVTVLPAAAFQPRRPFIGPLFEAMEAAAAEVAAAEPASARAGVAGAAALQAGAAEAGAAEAAAAGAAEAAAAQAAPAQPAAVLTDRRCIVLVVPVVHCGAAAAMPEARRGGVPAAGKSATSPEGEMLEGCETPGESRTLVVITDHVNLVGRGPLTGRWPPEKPRTFPAMNGVYAPAVAEALLLAALPDESEVNSAGMPHPRQTGGEEPSAGECERCAGEEPSAGEEPTACERKPHAGECEPEDGRSAAGPAVYSRLAVAGVADTGRPTVFEVEQARAAGLSWASSCLVAPVVIAAYYGLVVAAVGVPGGR